MVESEDQREPLVEETLRLGALDRDYVVMLAHTRN
jgi:hypothetical protein